MFWFGLKLDDTLDANVKILNDAVVGHEGKYSYVYLDYEKFEGFLSQQMGCTAVNCGVLVKNNVKYRLSDNGDEFSVEGIKAFLTRDAEGKLEQFLKSQDVPAEREEDNVVVLVGKNFEEEVKGKNVFVFFYAPWCGHCKNAKPDYQKLKAELNRSDVVVAQLDATENDIPHAKVDVQGFPTFYLFKADDYENPVAYNGGRTLNDWVSWLNTEVPAGAKSDL